MRDIRLIDMSNLDFQKVFNISTLKCRNRSNVDCFNIIEKAEVPNVEIRHFDVSNVEIEICHCLDMFVECRKVERGANLTYLDKTDILFIINFMTRIYSKGLQ